MKLSHRSTFKVIAALVIVAALVFGVISTSQAYGIPIISIKSVVGDASVTISGVNFPADQTFTVRMGAFGTLGIGGVVVGTKEPASGSAFTATYTIPASLVGASKIAIRLDSPQGFYSYNWFYNHEAPVATPAVPAGTPAPTYMGIPTFNISTVVNGTSVTVQASNFPAGQTFTVKMGEFGTLALGGTVIGTTSSGSGGVFSATYAIPAALAGASKIAIRMDSPQGYYAYNWFYNNTTSVTTPAATAAVPTTPAYTGFPTMSIVSVVKDSKVTIHAMNVPAGETMTVLMGEFGTMGVNGIVVTKISSGTGGNFDATYMIPAALTGRYKIAIRLEMSSGYYAYNWFFNN
jgi:hypothetical protein